MAFLSLSVSLSAPAPRTALFVAQSPLSTSSSVFVRSPSETLALLPPPLNCLQRNRREMLTRGRRRSWIVRMAPEEEKMTRRSPLDFPIEWDRPKPARRPDIFPQFSPMKTPLPPPMPADPEEEDDEEEEEENKEEGEDEENEGDEPDKDPPKEL